MYRALMERASSFRQEDRFLRRFAGLEARVVLRPTSEYKRLLRLSVEARRLADVAERNVVFEALRSCPSAEIEALGRLDVPYFGVLRGLDETDLEWQLSVLSAAVQASAARARANAATPPASDPPAS